MVFFVLPAQLETLTLTSESEATVKRQYQFIGEQLRRELVSGKYNIGDRLPPERDIASQLSVSRATVRDALIMLELENLVEVRKGSGVYVINLPDSASASGEADIGPFELLQARQLIESHVAEFAASQITRKEVKRLREALDMEREALEKGQSDIDGDRLFHITIAEATQNSALVEIVATLWNYRETSSMWSALHKRITDTDYRRQWLLEHEVIFLALKNKRPREARDAMWQHLESVKQTLLNIADAEDPDFDGYLFGA